MVLACHINGQNRKGDIITKESFEKAPNDKNIQALYLKMLIDHDDTLAIDYYEQNQITNHASQILYFINDKELFERYTVVRNIENCDEQSQAMYILTKYLHDNDLQSAQMIINEHIKKYGQTPFALIIQYDIYNKENSTDKKQDVYQNILDSTYKIDVFSLQHYARIMQLENDHESIVDLYLNSNNLYFNNSVLGRVCEACSLIIPQDRSLDFLRCFPDTKKHERNFVTYIAKIYINHGLYDEAISLLEKSLAHGETDALIHIDLIRILRFTCQDDKADNHIKNIDIQSLTGPTLNKEMILFWCVNKKDDWQKALEEIYNITCNNINDLDYQRNYMSIMLGIKKDFDMPQIVGENTYVKYTKNNTSYEIVICNDNKTHFVQKQSMESGYVSYLIGKSIGQEFTVPTKYRKEDRYKIISIKNKYIGLLHYIQEQLNTYTPEETGIERFEIDPENPNFEMIFNEVRNREKTFKEIIAYLMGNNMPISIIAAMWGITHIDIMNLIQINEHKIIDFALGMNVSQQGLDFAIEKGVVLDTYTAIIMCKSDLLESISKHIKLHISQQTIIDLYKNIGAGIDN